MVRMSEPTPPPAPPGPEVPAPPTTEPPAPPRYPLGPPLSAYGAADPDPRYQVEPSKTMAGWAIFLAIVPCFFPVASLVSIGLAITVLVKSQDGRDHGKKRAIAALIIATLWIVAFIVMFATGVFAGLQKDAERDKSGQVTDTSEVSSLKIRVGDCFDHPDLAGLDLESDEEATETTSVTAIPCPEPHDFEAYHAYDLPDGDYPGLSAVEMSAGTTCFKRFKSFVGIAYPKSDLEPYFLYPTKQSWGLLDDRTITCLIGEPGEKTTGTLGGTRR